MTLPHLLLALLLALLPSLQGTALAQHPAGNLPLPRALSLSPPDAAERLRQLPQHPDTALGRGILMVLARQNHEGDRALAQARPALPGMAAWQAAFQGVARYRQGDWSGALERFDAIEAANPVLGADAQLMAAYCLDALASPQALERYARFLEYQPDHPLRAVALLRAATLAGTTAQGGAEGWLRELVQGLPWTASAERGEAVARELYQAGTVRFDPDEPGNIAQRVETLLNKSQTAKALPLVERLLQTPGADMARALFLKGKALYARRDTQGAIQFFEDAAAAASDPLVKAWALYHQGRCHWRFSGAENAQAMEDLLGAALALAVSRPDGAELAENCRRLLMLSRVERARFPQALEAARAILAASPPGTEAREQAAWLSGLIRFALHDFAGARQDMEAFARDWPATDLAQGALYWQGRAAQAAGDDAGAGALYRQVLSAWPNGYYGLLAQERASALGDPAQATGAQATGAQATRDQTACAAALAAPAPAQAKPGLDRAVALESWQLAELAERELAVLASQYPREPAVALAAARLSTRLGNHLQAVRVAWKAFNGCLNTGGAQALAPLRDIFYPERYTADLERHLAGTGLDPALLKGLIRQESFFEPDAVSGAGAVGLMQMMPATARDQARKYGEKEPSADRLKDPALNLRFGVRYFQERFTENGGNVVLTLASYNAGRVKVGVWREFLGGLDQDLFTEFIPYAETRDYVKRIRGNQAMYRLLYAN